MIVAWPGLAGQHDGSALAVDMPCRRRFRDPGSERISFLETDPLANHGLKRFWSDFKKGFV